MSGTAYADMFKKVFAKSGKSLLSESFTTSVNYTVTCTEMGLGKDAPLDSEYKNLEQAIKLHSTGKEVQIYQYPLRRNIRPPETEFSQVLNINWEAMDRVRNNPAEYPKLVNLVKRALRKHADGVFRHGEIKVDDEGCGDFRLDMTNVMDGSGSRRYFIGVDAGNGIWFDPWNEDEGNLQEKIRDVLHGAANCLYVYDGGRSIIRIEDEVVGSVLNRTTHFDEISGIGGPALDTMGPPLESGMDRFLEKLRETLETYEAEGFWEARIKGEASPDGKMDIEIRYMDSELG